MVQANLFPGSSISWYSVNDNLMHCKKHGNVDWVYFFEGGKQHIICPTCLRDLLGGEILEATPKEVKSSSNVVMCFQCQETTNLEECELCGELVCPSHRIEGICDDCNESIERACGRGHGCS